MNPAAMVALIDYREIDGEERPVNATVAVGHNFNSDFTLIFRWSFEILHICKCPLSGNHVLQAWS